MRCLQLFLSCVSKSLCRQAGFRPWSNPSLPSSGSQVNFSDKKDKDCSESLDLTCVRTTYHGFGKRSRRRQVLGRYLIDQDVSLCRLTRNSLLSRLATFLNSGAYLIYRKSRLVEWVTHWLIHLLQ